MKGTVAVVTLLACAFTVAGQSREERWRQDVRFLADQLSTKHPNFFTQVTREQFNSATERLLARTAELTDPQVVVELARLAAMGGDAHTSLSLIQAATGIRSLPLRVMWFSDGLYVTQAAESNVRALGKRVVRIGDTPVDEVLDRLRPVISHENSGWLQQMSQPLLVAPDVLSALEIVPRGSTVRYFLDAGDGTEFAVNIGLTSGALFTRESARPLNPLWQRNAGQYYWFEYLEASRTVYLKYNVCRESPALTITEMAAQLTAFFAANPVERVILDVRNNGGGASRVLQDLMARTNAPQVGEIAAAGRLICIIGHQTFSSGMLAALQMRSNGAVLLGEPTGGRPDWYGEVVSMTLPNSGLTFQVSTRFVGTQGSRALAVDPDVLVPFTGADYFAEGDPWLEAALAR